MHKAKIQRFASFFLAFALIAAGLQAPIANAAMVDNERMAASVQLEQERQEIRTLLERDEVRSQLTAMGVDPTDAAERVDHMTESEVHMLSQKIQELPAGGSALEVIALVLVLFIILDAAGATDVFPRI